MHVISRSILALSLVSTSALSACAKSADAPAATTQQQQSDAGADASVTADRGPTTLMIDGDANGLLWDDDSQTLYVADNANNRILQWTDAAGFSKVADLPAAPSGGAGLGQLARLPDGSIIVTRFGFGIAGDVAIAKTDGTSSVIPNLDKTFRRIGIAVAPDGTIYDSYFVKGGSGDVGTVAKLTTDGKETSLVTTLQKPVGLAVIGDSLYMSDQDQGSLLVAKLATPSQTKVFATLPDADLICEGPNGEIFSGGSDGNVREVSSAGKTSVFAGGFQSARGVAFDKTNNRLFVADHGANDVIQIRPVD
jgi:sugar lactone lactonase YvrE